MNPKSHEVIIFTDGASRGNPGPGGYAAVVIVPENTNKIYDLRFKIYELGNKEEYTTNNRMELTAAIKALQQIQDSRFKIQVFSDSAYLINGITKWIYGWQKNGWKTAEKKEVENRDLWEKLISAAEGKKIEWKKIDGHSGIAGNERCDVIAQTYADLTQTDAEKKLKLYRGALANYPIKDILEIRKSQTLKSEKGLTLQKLKRARSRAAAHSYVSMVNGVIQAHKTWAECEKRVKGARGAKYQKVFSDNEERALFEKWSH